MKVRTKLFLLILITVSIAATISMLWMSYSSTKNTIRQAILSNNNFSKAIRDTVYILMKTGQQKSLNEYLNKESNDPLINEIRIVRSAKLQNNIGFKYTANPRDNLDRQVLSSGKEIIKDVFVGKDHAIRTVMPIIAEKRCLDCHPYVKAGETVAALSSIFVYQSFLDQMHQLMIKDGFIQILIFMFITGLILIYFNLLILKPIERIMAVITKMGKGDWKASNDLKDFIGYKSEKISSLKYLDEINELAVAFYEMSNNLQKLTVSRNDLTNEINERKLIEEKLRTSERYLSQIIDAIIDPIFVKDRQHRWVLINKAFCEFMGRTKEELNLKSDNDFFPKEETDVFWAKDEEVFLSGLENVNEEFFTDGKGKRRTIITKKTLYIDTMGNKYIVGNIHDITERKIIEEEILHQTRELKIFYDASIGREERILDLKKQVEQLKNENSKRNL